MTRNSSYNFCKSVVEKFVFLASVMICGDIGFLSPSFFFLSEEEEVIFFFRFRISHTISVLNVSISIYTQTNVISYIMILNIIYTYIYIYI